MEEDKDKFYSGYLPIINFNYSEDFIKSYPEFFIWIKTYKYNKDKTAIFLFNRDIPIGFSILKYSEQKISSFYLVPYFRNKGYSSLLMEESLKLLNVKYPLITVSELVKYEFTNLFSRYDYRLITELDNLYRENSVEYIFNREFKK